MIDKDIIKDLVENKIKDTVFFLVEIKVDANNNINIFVDSKDGVDISTCVSISKHVEQSLDRDSEDFSIEVSSPGIGKPFKVLEQYEKVINKTVEVLFNNGEKLQGVLLEIFDDYFIVEYSVKEKPEGAKRPKLVIKKQNVRFDEIKSTKEII